jgi:ketosteroid isomerase-like protein
MNLRAPISILAVLLLASFQAAAQTKASAAEASIREADQQWLKVFAAKDLDKSVAYCVDDASAMSQNTPIATGKEAIRNLFSGFFALPNLKISWQPNRIEVAKSGELGYTSGSYHMTFNDPSGKQLSETGKYVTVWRKQSSGGWKVVLDIFNSDAPEQ